VTSSLAHTGVDVCV